MTFTRLLGTARGCLRLEPALLVAFSARIWQSLAGLGTIYFVVAYFSPETQGYYQTFLSLIALQAFLELGIIVAIISVVSHEWAGLVIGPSGAVTGAPDKCARLSAATRFVAIWFSGLSALLLVVGGSVGYAILSQHGHSDLWLAPWLAAVATAAAFLWCQGQIAVLEGCNQVFQVAVYRLVQAVASVLALWVAVISGAELWSLVAMLAANLVCALVFLGFVYRHFLGGLLRSRTASSFRWRADIWPMQWPLALQGTTNYFMFSLFVPVLFTFHGVVEAGRMGLSLQVVLALLGIATTWLTIAAPRMGTAFASGDKARYERIWHGSALASMLVIGSGAIVIGIVIWFGASSGLALVARFLDPAPFWLLLAWGVSLHAVQCMASYWRAQREEPMRFWGVVPGAVTGLAVWALGRNYGSLGAAGAALAASLLVGLPLALFFFRRTRTGRASRG
ncbi:hypothetical protein SH591_10680 [Sphingomonas sp. LY54]|uniref:hypothetical protein n=1 Tax=Sphingomonas sp. LY54 TaxID=3095343 RepID=UPI002D77C3F6|nr:hypothetical protein [Sphingomonas sp. LY54]WRP27583.1 hypothetical protein SH591_10680 [Sphingomonas sp. LY54]